jgi:hypothetical protein
LGSERNQVRQEIKSFLKDQGVELTADIRKALPSRFNTGNAKALWTALKEAPIEETKVSDDDKLSEDVNAIVEKAVKIATESLKTEINSLVSAKEAATNKAISLESELATAKSLAVAGGPKRTIKPIDHASNDLLVKAATYKAKADASTDPDLTKGYKILAEKYFAEAAALTESN